MLDRKQKHFPLCLRCTSNQTTEMWQEKTIYHDNHILSYSDIMIMIRSGITSFNKITQNIYQPIIYFCIISEHTDYNVDYFILLLRYYIVIVYNGCRNEEVIFINITLCSRFDLFLTYNTEWWRTLFYSTHWQNIDIYFIATDTDIMIKIFTLCRLLNPVYIMSVCFLHTLLLIWWNFI